jgi:hypothetical protein
MTEFLIAGVLLISYLLPLYQGTMLAGTGSDNSVHVFLIRAIRNNHFRLFTRVPRIINESYCGAFPLMLHLLLSRLPIKALDRIAVHLNPSMNLVLCSLTWLSAGLALQGGLFSLGALAAVSVMTFTPQYYNAFNARNHGVSSRSLGIVFFGVFQCLYFLTESHGFGLLLSLSVCVLGYCVLAFNTFATQALVLAVIVYSFWTGTWAQLIFLGLSIAAFLIVHPRYASSYLKHTLLFINKYRTALADIFILKQRYSIWRDLTGDILAKFREEGARRGGSYAYGNSLLVLVFQNPIAIVGGLGGWFVEIDTPYVEFCWRIASIALLIFFFTSFRATRFLGEPERYIEIATPFSVVAAVSFLLDTWGFLAVGIALCYQILATIGQLVVAKRLSRYLEERWTGVRTLLDEIAARVDPAHIRFGSNNDEIVKVAMQRPWSFARHWSFEMPFAGLDVGEAFRAYPMMYPAAFAKVIDTYDLNAVVIEKAEWDFLAPDSIKVLKNFTEIAGDENHKAFVRESRT